MTMNKARFSAGVLALSALLSCGFDAAGADAFSKNAPKDCDSARLRFTMVERTLTPTISVKFRSGETLTVTPKVGDDSVETIYVKYADRGKWEKANGPIPRKKYPNEFVDFPQLGVKFYCRPNPMCYDIPVPNETLLSWEKDYVDALRREMTFEVRHEKRSDDARLYVNGQYAGRRKGVGPVRTVTVKGTQPAASAVIDSDDLSLEDKGPSFDLSFFAARSEDLFVTLPSRGPQHRGKRLDASAKLSVAPGFTTFGDVPMEVFPAGESIDPSLHRHTRHQGDLFMNYYNHRDAYNVSPEFSQWCVPSAFYSYAWVLCADLPREGAEPYVMTQLTRLSSYGSQAFGLGRHDLGSEGERTVGTLEWTEGGRRRSAPLKLVKVPVEPGAIIDLINDKPLYSEKGDLAHRYRINRRLKEVGDYLDFEFNGSGEWKKPSSVQIFGVTLEKCPYGVEMVQSEQGNIFYGDEKPETGVELTALCEEGTKGFVDCEIYDDAFNPVSSNRVPFSVAKAGEKTVLHFDLRQKKLGWYGLEFTFRNAEGERLFTHVGAFALLGPDVREAGYDSPYAAWPHNGRHCSNPDRRAVAKMMWKMGLRITWAPPLSNETDMAEWKVTESRLLGGQPESPCTAEELEKRLDALVEEGRQRLAAFPHLPRVIQLLHECGGRELAPEMVYKPAVRGTYRGIEGDWHTYYCTEFCKRMKKEFPEFKIQVGNGSSASEKIASLCRNGFDLSLVDQLGIESKGFQTMPELNSCLEAPGMLWALRETGRRFGYTNFTMNACNEYVFRPERTVRKGCTYNQRMDVTDFYLRDYLISLAHGVRCISTAHLEDSKTDYYDTNWGAGCMCKCFPYSYPKRCFVGIATLTKVLDCVERYPRRVPTGEVATYALEWARNRRTKDFAMAVWTPRYGAKLRMRWPKGTKLVHVGSFGHETPLEADADGAVILTVGPTPTYVVSSARAEGGEVTEHLLEELPSGFTELAKVNLSTVEVVDLEEKPQQFPSVGRFDHRDVSDPRLGTCLSAMLRKRDKPLPEVVWEYEHLKFKEPVAVTPAAVSELGVWIKGNGSFAGVDLVLRDPKNAKRRFSVALAYRNSIAFHGWHLMHGKLRGRPNEWPAKLVVDHLRVGSAALALDPREMVPVTEPVGVGPLVVLAKDGASAVAEIDAAEIVAAETMKERVGDKDLAGKEGVPAEPAPVAKEAPKYKFSSDLQVFLTRETRRPGFCEELKDRILAAWRRDLEGVFAKPRPGKPFASGDIRLVALSQLVNIGIPEIKPRGYVPRADKVAAVRDFAPETQTGVPNFDLKMGKMPEGVFGCIRMGPKGQHTFLFINFGDEQADGEFVVPQTFDVDMSNLGGLCDMFTGEMLKGWKGNYRLSVPAKGVRVLRSNSPPPEKKPSGGMGADDEPGIDLDD